MDSLVDSGSLQALIADLSKTAYRKPVEAALARATGIDCISLALREDLEAIIGNLINSTMEGRGTWYPSSYERMTLIT
jgi:hypothetical protein